MHSPDVQARPKVSGPSDFSYKATAVLFVVVLVIAAIPIVTHALPPLSDYVNHLGRTYVINHIGSDPDLARFYAIKWAVVPNLMIDLAMLVLNPFMDVYHAGQVFTLTAFVLIMSGTLALSRALFGSWSPLPLIATPLLYNEVILVGVMNYIFGIGLTLWAIAGWVALRDRFWPWRVAASTVFAVGLFFCHLYAVGIYGLAVLGIELQRFWSERDEPLLPRLLALAGAGLPFLVVLVLLGSSPTWGAAHGYAWTMSGKLEGLVFAVNTYYRLVAFVLTAAVVIGGAWAIHHRLLYVHPVMLPIFLVGSVVYLAMPRELFAAFMADQRLPIALVFILIACFRIDFRHQRTRQAFAALVVVLVAVRVIEVQTVWNRLGPATEEFYRSVMMIDRGSRVLVVHGDRSNNGMISDYGIVHAASIATIERSALVSTTFTVRGKQVLKVREAYKRYVEVEDRTPPSIPYFSQAARADVPYFFTQWPLHFDYVYILFTKPGAANPDPNDMTRIFDGAHFQLYRVNKQG